MTLDQAKIDAYTLGRKDAKQGCVYRHSYEKGSELRALGLDKHYDAGWHSWRNRT